MGSQTGVRPRWSTSASFVEADDKVGRVLGYLFALRALGVGGSDVPRTFDYGCGPGKVAHRLTNGYGDPRVAHLLMTNGEWLELPDCFWSAHSNQEILTEVGYTDLRTGAPLLVAADRLTGTADLGPWWSHDTERRHTPFMIIHGRRPEN